MLRAMGDAGDRASKPQRIAFETARLRLARYQLAGDHSRSQAAAHATQVSAEALAVERVGVWLFKDRGTRLVCASAFQRSTRQHSSGHVLEASQYPGYVRALQQHRAIAADDARSCPETRELTESYLVPMGITSMLDAPIIQGGKVIGVVCHEHIGEPRHWTERDIAFAGTVADMVTLVFGQADRLELEAALQEQALQRLEHQKMEALGRMASAVAHDFNNLLATFQGTLGLLSSGATPPRELDLKQLGSMVEFGRRLTQQLMTFGRSRGPEREQTVDLRELIERMQPVLRAGIPRTITLHVECTAQDPLVTGDPTQLEQVLINLCLNARDAIARTGTVSITLRDATEEDEVAPDHLILEVQDDGVGMSKATCERIFEPYFTTKPDGTGFGLASVYGIVHRGGGTIRALSAQGEGTRMVVAMPRASGS
jgi:two-component system cell cycle sensor histidine kinase/response regulator CckA